MRKIIAFCLLISFIACKKELKKNYSAPKATSVQPTNDSIIAIDIAIRNGKIVDGTGSVPYLSTIYLKDDRILFIGKLTNPKLKIGITIDATGKIVTPGFIDLHAHGNPLSTPDFENFLAMGVTTIGLGQDGASPNQRDLASYIERVNQLKLGVNIAQFVGHGTLRNLTGIGSQRNVSAAKLTEMQDLLKQQLHYCFGLTTGLEYNPGLYASQEELEALAKVVGAENKVISSHMRNEDDDAILTSITELAAQGKYARVHISHLKSVYGKGAERALAILDTIEKFRAIGIDLTADSYPYLASYTGIAIVFPDWSKTSAQFAIAKKNRRDELEKFIRDKVNRRNGPEATLFGTAPYTGKTLADIAKEKNKPFEAVLIDDIGPQGASAAYFVMDKTLQETLLLNPWVGVASDGSKTGTHPRGHGTFAKIIEDYVVKDSLLSLPEAIRKMTSFPAEILGLKNRGIIKVGKIADLIIFDPQQVHAIATFNAPFQLAQGFETVILSGTISRQNGALTNQRKGKILDPNEKL